MNINNIKKPQKRVNLRYLQELNLQSYGSNNLYPQDMAQVIASSSIGGTCLDRYCTFIEGNGFDNTEFSQFVCNRFGDTIDDILHLIAVDLGKYNGFAIHVNYNAMGEIVEMQHIHFEDTRLEEEDSNGYVAKIALHPDWTGQKTRNGKVLRVTKDSVRKVFPFNPRKEVVLSQIAFCGGVENYCGQIMWISMDGRYQYPKPIYDKIITALSTDEGVDNVLYRNARNNFMAAGALVHKKGTIIGMDDDGNPIDQTERDEAFGESLNTFLGDTNAASIMDITYEQEEDKPQFLNFRGNNYDKDFDSTSAYIESKIYAAFQQEVWHLIAVGKIGFGGEVLKDAYKVYNSFVSPQRRAISRAFAKIFEYWTKLENVPQNDFEIQPLVLIDEVQNNVTTNHEI